jgi:hypothetical protein
VVTFDKGEYECSSNVDQDDYQVMTRPEFLSPLPATPGGSTLASALRLCTHASPCKRLGLSALTISLTSQIPSNSSNGDSASKHFAFNASAGEITASLQVVAPINQCTSIVCLTQPDIWFRSNLNWQMAILDQAGTVVAGPVSNSNFKGVSLLPFIITTRLHTCYTHTLLQALVLFVVPVE